MNRSATREQRYWEKVDAGEPDGCWEWTACRNPCGYGMFRGDGKEQLAHRFGFRLANGPIPDGGQVLHHCDNPPCQNPSHLFLGDPAINCADKVAKGRQGHPYQPGEENGGARMTAPQILEIRARYLAGEPQRELAAAFDTTQRNISRIVRGKRWGIYRRPKWMDVAVDGAVTLTPIANSLGLKLRKYGPSTRRTQSVSRRSQHGSTYARSPSVGLCMA